MPTFYPFDSNHSPFFHNASIYRELSNPGLPKVPYPDFPLGPYLRPFIKASGLTPVELCELMQRPHGKTIITSELIEKSLTDFTPEMWIICRIFKALHLSWDDYRLLNKGPRLHTLLRYEDWLLFSTRLTSDHLMRQLDTGRKYVFSVLEPEEMGNIIATEFETCIHPIVQELDIVAAFLYHRYPKEVHLYDIEGKLLACGDTQFSLPKGLILI